MDFDRSILKKIRYQVKEAKFPVAWWAITAVLDYIDYLEKRIEELEAPTSSEFAKETAKLMCDKDDEYKL